MATSVYAINKVVDKPVEFRGLKAQYIWYLAIGLVLLLFLFAILYISSLNTFICLGLTLLLGSVLFIQVYKLNNRFGQYGMMKKIAAHKTPAHIRIHSKKVFTNLYRKSCKEN